MPTKPVGRPPFGDEPLVALHASITAEQKAWLAEQGGERGISQAVRDALDAWMEKVAIERAELFRRKEILDRYISDRSAELAEIA